MTCEEALKKLYEIVDKEATETDKKEVQEHLEHCRHCMSRYEFETMFRTLVTEKASIKSGSTDRLKTQIMKRIGQAEKSSGWSFSNPFKYKSVFVAVAASLVICILAAFATSKFYRHKTFIYPFEENHLAYNIETADGPGDMSAMPEIERYVTNDLHLAMSGPAPGFVLTDCGFDDIREQRFAHLRYIKDGANVSLFIGSAGIDMPDFERAVKSGIEYFKHVCSECQVIYWIEGGALKVTVSDNNAVDLTSFMPVSSAI